MTSPNSQTQNFVFLRSTSRITKKIHSIVRPKSTPCFHIWLSFHLINSSSTIMSPTRAELLVPCVHHPRDRLLAFTVSPSLTSVLSSLMSSCFPFRHWIPSSMVCGVRHTGSGQFLVGSSTCRQPLLQQHQGVPRAGQHDRHQSQASPGLLQLGKEGRSGSQPTGQLHPGQFLYGRRGSTPHHFRHQRRWNLQSLPLNHLCPEAD